MKHEFSVPAGYKDCCIFAINKYVGTLQGDYTKCALYHNLAEYMKTRYARYNIIYTIYLTDEQLQLLQVAIEYILHQNIFNKYMIEPYESIFDIINELLLEQGVN